MKKFILLGIAILLLVLLTAGQGQAEPAFIEATQTQYICLIDYSGAKMWESGNTSHGRGIVEKQYIIGGPDHPELTGPIYIDDVNWNINLKTMSGASWGTFYHEMPALGGAFTGTWNGKVRPSGVIGPLGMPLWLMDGHAVGYGVGELEGKLVKTTIEQEIYDPGVEGHPCDYFTPYPGYPMPMSYVRSQNTVRIIEATD